MSETKDPRRTRRRASRTAGPPVEDATEKLTVDSAAAGSTADKAIGEAVSAAAGKSAGTAAEKSVDASAAKPEGVTAAKSEDVASAKSEGVIAAKSEDVTERIDTTTESAPVAESGATDETVRIDKSAAGTVAPVETAAESAGTSDTADKETGATVVSMEKSAATESGGAEPAVKGGSRSWKRIVALTAAAVLVIGLVGAAVVSMIAVQSTEQRDERRAEYVATARQTVLNLTTIRADTAKEDIDRILTMASGEFKTEFDGRIDPFTEIVKQAKVQSTGEVVEAAVERDDENSAVILVAAKQTLTNAGAEGEQQRYYRFRVTVQRADDGALTASDVEFVA
ncbi:hypothetical protein [Nocardia flavorosea]|uniref:Mce-associated membrane protein n=1 Tax=Nocardia flavorosea TaxID=53429 RepID=A0A846YDP4_9NOCA|nr:hypothetical protein [Nocardia flavorosea]NKY55854.1 hypothetical protein [Nocardia flavorosea]